MSDRAETWAPRDGRPIPDNFRELVAAHRDKPATEPPAERDPDPKERQAGDGGE